MNYTPDDIYIKIAQDKNQKALVSLKFGQMTIKGFRIMRSKLGDGLWVVPPSYKIGQQYHPLFYLSDKIEWGKLSEAIKDAYKKKLIESEEIDISEISLD